MEPALKILGALLAASFCGLLIRDKNPVGALALSLCACAVMIRLMEPSLVQLMTWCRETADLLGGQTLITPLLRCLGVALAVRIAAESCRDAGERALAAQAELAGAVCGLLTVLPLIQRMMELISGL